MKKLSLFILILLAASCSKKEVCESAECLPSLTTEGKGTIACLINGKAFQPGGSQLSGPTQQASYDYVEGRYYFGLSANYRKANESIRIYLGDNIIEEGETFSLMARGESSNYGEYKNGLVRNFTSELHTGEITFIKFDNINGIVSGTFWFDAVNEDGEVTEIREGRFDMKYN